MKIDINNLGETYNKCIISGSILEKNSIDVELIKEINKKLEEY